MRAIVNKSVLVMWIRGLVGGFDVEILGVLLPPSWTAVDVDGGGCWLDINHDAKGAVSLAVTLPDQLIRAPGAKSGTRQLIVEGWGDIGRFLLVGRTAGRGLLGERRKLVASTRMKPSRWRAVDGIVLPRAVAAS
jgi:hypothetical protein